MVGLSISQLHLRPHVVVLGGGYAGLAAATRIGRIANVWVTVVDVRAAFVERIRLHQAATGQTPATFSLSGISGTARYTLRASRA